MFRLLMSHLQAYFSHKTLCTHWDPIVFTSMEYTKSSRVYKGLDWINNPEQDSPEAQFNKLGNEHSHPQNDGIPLITEILLSFPNEV